jgi:predicted Zn-dependent protease
MKQVIDFRKLLFVLIAVLFVPSCAVNPVTGKKQLMLMSESQEVALGAQYDPQVIATFGEYQDKELLSFVEVVTAEMGTISHRPNLKYHIKILDSPVVNAFAVPGGYIYLTRGILAQFNNEAELIGVIGHEMGHITARHSASQQTKQQLGTLLLIGGMIASEKFAHMAEYAFQGMQLLFLKFSRDDERQADQLGAEYSSRIGYDAGKMADFFQVLNKMHLSESEGGVPTFLSTHPDPGDRYNSVKRYASEWQQQLNFSNWKVNADNYLKLIDGIVYGEDPRQGYVEGNIFYHPDLKFRFSFPSGWELQNSPIQVSMAPHGGNALAVFTLANANSLQEAAQQTLQQLGLEVQQSGSTTVNGLPAIAAISRQVVQDQSTGATHSNIILSYFIEYDSRFYVFHGASSEAEFASYRNSLEGIMKSFARLTDSSKINVKPQRVFVKAASRNATLASTFSSLGVPQSMMEELALLNNMELTDQVRAGKLIKIVGK